MINDTVTIVDKERGRSVFFTRGKQTFEASVYYSLGGMNYFTGTAEPRGFYLSVSPVERSEKNGITIKTYAAFSGTKILVEPAKRFSKKGLNANMFYLDENNDKFVELLNHVAVKAGIVV